MTNWLPLAETDCAMSHWLPDIKPKMDSLAHSELTVVTKNLKNSEFRSSHLIFYISVPITTNKGFFF
jgi:hypothetical protein